MIRHRTIATALTAMLLIAGTISCASAQDTPMSTSTTDAADAPNRPARYHIPTPVGPTMRIIYLGPGVAKYAGFMLTGSTSGVDGIELDIGEQTDVDGYSIKLVEVRGTDHLPTAVAHLVVTDPSGNRII